MRTLLAAAALSTIACSTAHAKDMSGRFGVGADAPLLASGLGRPAGLNVVYRASKSFGIQGIFGFDYAQNAVPVVGNVSVTQIGVSIRGHVGVVYTKNVNLDAVFGTTIVNTRIDNPVDDLSSTGVSFDGGLRPEWFVTDYFSFHAQVGIAITLIDEGNGFADGGVLVDVFQASNFLGDAGFTFWF